MSVFYAVGRYACRITSQALGQAQTGTPQFILRFTVEGSVDDDGGVTKVNRQYERSAYRAITEKTMPYLIEDLKSLGFHGASFRDLDPNSQNFFDLAGRMVDMYCAHELAQDGQNREKWSVARQGGAKKEAPQVKQLDAKKLRDLDNLFGKHLKGLGPKPQAAPESNGVDFSKRLTQPVPVTQPVADSGITDDDVPF